MHCRLPLPPYHCRPDITPPWVGPTLNRRWHASYCADTDTLALLTDKTKQASEAHKTAAEAAATINRLQVEQVGEPGPSRVYCEQGGVLFARRPPSTASR